MLEIVNLTKVFNPSTVNEMVALAGVSLSLDEGDYVAVIGGNGAGKSTLLNAIAGVYPPDGGRIEIDGKDVKSLPEHKRAAFLGRVFQDPMMGTAGDMLIEENLALARRRGKFRTLSWSISTAERNEYRELLSGLGLGLEDRLKTKAKLLSGGQRQALTLVMATLRNPKVLLLDEHAAALDPKTAATVMEITDRIVGSHNLTTLMITHNMHDAIKHGNRLIMMHKGTVVVDIRGKEKESLTVPDLLAQFQIASGDSFTDDRALLG